MDLKEGSQSPNTTMKKRTNKVVSKATSKAASKAPSKAASEVATSVGVATKKKKRTRLSKLALCIRKNANTVKLPRNLMPDSPDFNASDITPGLSAKFEQLLSKIQELDEADLRDHGTLFKHFIFTDIRESAFGAKAIGAFLMSAGFELRMGQKEKYIKRVGKLVKTKAGETLYLPKEPVKGGCNGFAMLQSLPLWKNSLSVSAKKTILGAYNSRPDNTYGELLRIIILDSKYKEGIDLFDVKHVHLMEPTVATSDLKQAIGRATRYCGQKGLPFQPRSGWRLNVYIYNAELPKRDPFLLEDGNDDAHKLMMQKSGLDLALINLSQEITILAIQTAVDYELNYKINNFNIEEALLAEEGAESLFPKPAPSNSMAEFQKYKWLNPVVKSGCDAIMEKGKAAVFSKTQDFIRHYFTPARPIKGLLAWHSVGTGKTCMAVAAATTEFEQAGYTILWVTRNALMADVYKNIFGTVCAIPLMKEGTVFPDDIKKQKRLLSKSWLPPISYRTFQNALEKKNEIGRMLYKRNPSDPLRKVFLVIDEIHKLQEGDLSAAEAADFHTIQKYIHRSYDESGDNSVRPLLMTATPITDSPKELFEILNTIIPKEADRLAPLDEFREKFTNSEGSISDEGREYYKQRAKGIVSYLNREFDPTTFAQPKFNTVSVRISNSSSMESSVFIDRYMSQLGLDNLLAEEMTERDCDADLRNVLSQIDSQITSLESALQESEDKEEKKELKLKIKALTQSMKDAKTRHKTRRIKCVKTNKEIAKAEINTRKAFLTSLIRDMKVKYEKEMKESSSEQVKALEGCFQFKRDASKEFTKVANERFFPKKVTSHGSRVVSDSA